MNLSEAEPEVGIDIPKAIAVGGPGQMPIEFVGVVVLMDDDPAENWPRWKRVTQTGNWYVNGGVSNRFTCHNRRTSS